MRQRIVIVVATLAVASLLWGCERAGSASSPDEGGTAESGGPEKAQGGGLGARPLRGHGEEATGEHRECGGGGGCGDVSGAPQGEGPMQAPVSLGAEAGEGVEVVDAAAVVANPEQYRGKSISVTGTVKGFCHHGRGWYAIDVPGASPPYLRILAAPAFSVPEGAMGSTVVTHGTVDVQELPRMQAEHFEEEHSLGTVEGEDQGETVTRAVFRAAGATFTPAGATDEPAEPTAD